MIITLALKYVENVEGNWEFCVDEFEIFHNIVITNIFKADTIFGGCITKGFICEAKIIT